MNQRVTATLNQGKPRIQFGDAAPIPADAAAIQKAREFKPSLAPYTAAASPDEKAKAKAQAEDLFKQVKANPKKFGELAAKFSKDPGSAEKGGDLGFFGRGLMVKPFDETAFSMKVGDIAGPVETQYGYHVIRLDAIKAMQSTPLEAARQQIETEIRKPKVVKAFAEAADNFNNLVYEQFDSLQPAVDALKLTLQKSEWVSRAGGNPNPLLNNDKLLAALFSDEVLKNKHNTSAIEVQPNMLLAARVIEHKDSEGVPLDQVRKDILQQRVNYQQAAKQPLPFPQAPLPTLAS